MSQSGDGVVISVCTECGAGYFPHRLLCPRCGNEVWDTRRVMSGDLEEVTVIRTGFDRPDEEPSYLGSVRAEGVAPLVVGLSQELERGTRISLSQRDGGVYGQPEQ